MTEPVMDPLRGQRCIHSEGSLVSMARSNSETRYPRRSQHGVHRAGFNSRGSSLVKGTVDAYVAMQETSFTRVEILLRTQ